jgi:hypothetical protein
MKVVLVLLLVALFTDGVPVTKYVCTFILSTGCIVAYLFRNRHWKPAMDLPSGSTADLLVSTRADVSAKGAVGIH